MRRRKSMEVTGRSLLRISIDLLDYMPSVSVNPIAYNGTKSFLN